MDANHVIEIRCDIGLKYLKKVSQQIFTFLSYFLNGSKKVKGKKKKKKLLFSWKEK